MIDTIQATKCEWCHEPLTKEEIESPCLAHDTDPLCEECWQRYLWDEGFHCCLCDEQHEQKHEGDLFVVVDADAAGVPVGLYRPKRRPYYSQAIVGGGHIHEHSVERVGDVPADADTDDYPCGNICEWCEAQLRAVP